MVLFLISSIYGYHGNCHYMQVKLLNGYYGKQRGRKMRLHMKTNTLTKQWLGRPLVTIALITGLALGQSAQASTVTAVTGPNSFSMWDFSWDVNFAPCTGIIEYDNGDGTIDAASGLAADTVRITGDDSGTPPGGFNSLTSMTTAYPVNGGDVTFSWSYELQDSLNGFDPFVFVSDLLVGVTGLQVVADGSGAMAGSAFFSLTENAIWGLAVRSLDGTYGTGYSYYI
jgi:hypothetical protein